ncbi:MAG: hypothetical protein U1F43_07125 [Myxococcota bacterium]
MKARGGSTEEAGRIAWATVNKQDGGAKGPGAKSKKPSTAGASKKKKKSSSAAGAKSKKTSAAGAKAKKTSAAGAKSKSTGAKRKRSSSQSGKVKPMVLLWALGVPIPIVLIIMLVRGCT